MPNIGCLGSTQSAYKNTWNAWEKTSEVLREDTGEDAVKVFMKALGGTIARTSFTVVIEHCLPYTRMGDDNCAISCSRLSMKRVSSTKLSGQADIISHTKELNANAVIIEFQGMLHVVRGGLTVELIHGRAGTF